MLSAIILELLWVLQDSQGTEPPYGENLDTKKSTPPSAFLQQNDYLKKGGELIIAYQPEYYEKNLISSICIRCLSVYGYMISIKHEEIV